MDEVWRCAPAAALCVAEGAGGLQVQANEVAAAWAGRHGVAAADWQALAAALLAPGAAATAEVVLGPRRLPVGCRRVALPDGRWLLWLALPADDERIAAVRRATEFLDRALSLAGISVWRLDLQSQRIHFNAVGFELQGLQQDPAGVPLAAVRDTIHPDDHAAVLRGAEEALASGRVIDVTARYRRPGGGWRTLLTRRVADRDDNGVVTGLAGISLDISEQAADRDRADTLARHSQLVAEALGIGFWSRDLDAGTAHWDEQMFRIHGRAPEQGAPPFGGWIDLYVHPADRAWLAERHRRAMAEWEPVVDVTFRAVASDGGERWIQSWTRRLVRDGRRLAFGMHLDVTERRRHEASLERERQRTQFAIEAAEVGIWERGLDGRAGYWNAEMYRLRGLDPADPRPIDELGVLCGHPDDLQALSALVQRRLEDGTPYRFEFRIRRPDGQWRWLVTQGRAMRGGDGRLIGMAGINIDITERREAEALRQQSAGAERASRDKSAFLARVSHELRTPMNAVLGFTQLLEDDGVDPPTPRQRARLQRINEAGSQMVALIDDLLDLARLDTGPPAGPAEPVPVAGLFDELLSRLSGVAQQRGVLLRVAPAAGPAAVLTQRARLAQLLMHLVGHAVRQQRAGGWVELSSRLEPHRPAAAGGAPAFDGVITVRDNGPGYSDTEQATLFEPFLRHGEAGRSGEGTGIALSLAQRLAAVLGVQIEVDSAPGGGSEFRLRVAAAPPVPAAPAPARTPGTVPPVPPAAALQVLCVEDNPVNLLLVRELLSLRPAVRLREAVDGRSGLASALAQRPDLVLLDLQLPDISGLEVLARLRGEPAMAGCVYVALSANAMPDHIAAALAAGFDDYWTKPIDFERFLAGVDAVAQRVHGASLSRTQAPPSSL